MAEIITTTRTRQERVTRKKTVRPDGTVTTSKTEETTRTVTTTRRVSLATAASAEREIIGGFSEPGKMPWLSYSIPAEECGVGSRLREVPGSVCSDCYACKNRYHLPNVQDAMYRRYEALGDGLSTRKWARNMTAALRSRAARFQPSAGDQYPAFRWHDSGDLQSVEHLSAIACVANGTQDVTLADGTVADIHHWLPTREYRIVADYLKSGWELPRNLTVRLSAHMIDGPAPTRFGLPVSTVHSEPGIYPTASECPAYAQGGQCHDCRTCWNPAVAHVSYPQH